MIRAESSRRRTAALVPYDGTSSRRRRALLLDEIVDQGQGCAEILPAMRGTILRKVGNGFEGEISIGDQVSESQQ